MQLRDLHGGISNSSDLDILFLFLAPGGSCRRITPGQPSSQILLSEAVSKNSRGGDKGGRVLKSEPLG